MPTASNLINSAMSTSAAVADYQFAGLCSGMGDSKLSLTAAVVLLYTCGSAGQIPGLLLPEALH